MTAESMLADGTRALHLKLSRQTRDRLLQYVALLHKWNRVYNLTAVREPQAMVSQHILDSLAVTPHIVGKRILDVGSGAGLPGIPLALIRPESAVTLLDSNHKKAAFLRQASIELNLRNIEVVCERVETWDAGRLFDVVISRAFAELREFVMAAGRLCEADGTLAAMKGVHPYEELAQIPAGYEVRDVRPLTVPGLAAQRHLVLLQRSAAH